MTAFCLRSIAEDDFEDTEAIEKRSEIEKCLEDEGTTLEQWQALAKGRGGLIAGNVNNLYYGLLEHRIHPSLSSETYMYITQICIILKNFMKSFPTYGRQDLMSLKQDNTV